ncbi:MAG TPA: TIM barrel protein [Phycisphaerae bacterium]|nr:TIM barrel protein [Phycisphaerae bacterium]
MPDDTAPTTRRQFLASAAVGALVAAGGARADESASAPAATKPRLELGFPTYMFKNYTLDQTIEMMRRVAVGHICIRSNLLPLSSTDEQIAAAIRKVTDAGLSVYGGGVIYMRTEPDVGRAFEYARAAGFKLISISLRPELLGLLEKKVREHDIRAAIHNHGPEDKLWPTPAAIHEKVRTLDRRIGICHDTGHTLRAGADPVAQTLQTADRLMDIHLKDVDQAAAKGHSLELGRGIMDVPKFLRALAKIGFAGVLGIEYEKHMDDLLPGLAESVGYVRGVMAGMARQDASS